jgi:hypothetical protein
MDGAESRQTNKYSPAAGTGDRHDDFTGNEIFAGWSSVLTHNKAQLTSLNRRNCGDRRLA